VKKSIFLLLLVILIGGCATVTTKEQNGSIEHTIIRYDLNGMTDKQIKNYFNQCITNDLIFLYRGGVSGWYLIEDVNDNELVSNLEWIGIGCTGGVEEGYKFNKLMIGHIKSRR